LITFYILEELRLRFARLWICRNRSDVKYQNCSPISWPIVTWRFDVWLAVMASAMEMPAVEVAEMVVAWQKLLWHRRRRKNKIKKYNPSLSEYEDAESSSRLHLSSTLFHVCSSWQLIWKDEVKRLSASSQNGTRKINDNMKSMDYIFVTIFELIIFK
jgi:hypothetical protein